MKILSLPIILTIGLTGCASLQPKPYAEPMAGQTATLTIANQSDARLRVWHMANAKNCSETSYVNGGAGVAAQTTSRLRYSAGKKIAFYITGLKENNFQKSQCSFIFSTNLAANGSYVLVYSYDGEKCHLSEAKFEPDGTVTREKFLVPREYTAGGELFGWCGSEK